MNIVDPLLATNNLGRSVSRANFLRIRRALALGSAKLEFAMSCPDKVSAKLAFAEMFRTARDVE